MRRADDFNVAPHASPPIPLADPAVGDVVISPDGMEAWLEHGPGAPARRSDAAAALAAAGVVFGLRNLADGKHRRRGPRLVAVGQPAKPGRDGRLEIWAGSSRQALDGDAEPDGSVDLRGWNDLTDVRAGDLVGRVVPPEPGVAGMTVTGEVLPARPGRACPTAGGANIALHDDGTLEALADGFLETGNGVVEVRRAFVVDGDVGFATGSIAFSGDVIVRGSVQPRFRVHSGGRVVVHGNVDEAEVVGAEGVRVNGTVAGLHASVRSNQDVTVRTVNQAHIAAGHNVHIERESHEAYIVAGDSVALTSPPNRIAGGTVIAGRSIVASELGSLGESTTRLVVRGRAAGGTNGEGSGEDSGDDEDSSNSPAIVARLAVRPHVQLEVDGCRLVTRDHAFRVAAVVKAGRLRLEPLERARRSSLR